MIPATRAHASVDRDHYAARRCRRMRVRVRSVMASTMSERRRYDFEVDGVGMVGDLYVPTASEARAVAVVTGPLTSVKEQAAGAYGRALAERGLIALAFDHRTFGESGGEPRQFENPFAKVRDVTGAASALLT